MVEKEGWTHERILGQWQQYALRRYLNLEKIFPQLVTRKIFSKKWSTYLAGEGYDIDLFLGQLKKKNVEKFTKFFELLEETFEEIANHKALVSTMAEHLLQISDADAEQKERIARVVLSATQAETCTPVADSEEGTTDIESYGITRMEEGKEGEKKDEGGVGKGSSEVQSETILGMAARVPQERVVSEKLKAPSLSSESARTALLGSDPVRLQYLAQALTLESAPTPSSESKELSQSSSPITSFSTTSTPLEDSAEGPLQTSVPITPISNPSITTEDPLQSSTHTTQFPRPVHPSGFVEPPIEEVFERSKLINGQWLLHDPAHGISIQISEDAVPLEINTFILTIHAYLNGPFYIPEEYEICAAIFLLHVHSHSTLAPFQFLKPVTLRIPHSALVDEDELEDFLVLRAPDPDCPTPRDPCNTGEEVVYNFTDCIKDADFRSGCYVKVQLEHFCGISCVKQKYQYRNRHRSMSSILYRHGSLVAQNTARLRMRQRKKKRLQYLTQHSSGSIGSVGSSRQSSLSVSFEESQPCLEQPASTLVQSSSSTENGSLSQHLTRQAAVDFDDLRQLSSSNGSEESCNRLCICCVSPVDRSRSWSTVFMVACAHPTGRLAIHKLLKKIQASTSIDWEEKNIITYQQHLSFDPSDYRKCNWSVKAQTATPKITVDQVTDAFRKGTQPPLVPCITYTIVCHSETPTTADPLSLQIHVRGALDYNEDTYFMLTSTECQQRITGRVVCTPLWLFQEDSKIRRVLQNGTDFILDFTDIEHCKLIADVALQCTEDDCASLVSSSAISQAALNQVEADMETSNLPERVYQIAMEWIKRCVFVTLHQVISALNFVDITTNVPLHQFDSRFCEIPCDECWVLELRKQISAQWQFFGRYLGLPRITLDDLKGRKKFEGTPEIVIQMLNVWRQRYGRDASVGNLLKVIYRVYKLNSLYGGDAWHAAVWMAEESRLRLSFDLPQ